MGRTDIHVELKMKNRLLAEQVKVLVNSIEGYTIQSSNTPQGTDLLIYELSKEEEKDFQWIQSVINTGEVNDVFLVGENTDPDTLLKAIKVGAREYFRVPLNEKEIFQSLNKYKTKKEKEKSPEIKKSGKIFTLLGGKGGTGTTTVAVNLATMLASDAKVALVDMNQVFGDIPQFLDVKADYSWGEIVKNIHRLDSTFLQNVLVKSSSGVFILPSPSYLNPDNVVNPDIIGRLINIMRGMFDIIVIDTGQAIDNMGLRIISMSDMLFIVSILSIPCLSNTNKLIRLFAGFGYPPLENIKVVINRYLEKSNISIKDAEAAIKHKIYWTIPNDYPSTVSAINNSRPLALLAPRAKITNNFRVFADTIMEKVPEKKKWWKFGTG